MKRILPVIIVALLIFFRLVHDDRPWKGGGGTQWSDAPASAASGDAAIASAFQQHDTNVRVQGSGTVIKVLRDDTEGIEHQKFLLRLASGQTILIAHNIDIAGRIEGLKEGDTVEFCGEYVWDSRGGLVHWTHSDPQGRHAPGWLKCNGRTYQ